MELNNKKVLVLGLSKSGIAAAKALQNHGAKVYITEGKTKEIPQDLIALGIKIEVGGHSDEFIKDTQLAITSPGIPPHSEIFARLKSQNTEIISEIELAFNGLPLAKPCICAFNFPSSLILEDVSFSTLFSTVSILSFNPLLILFN